MVVLDYEGWILRRMTWFLRCFHHLIEQRYVSRQKQTVGLPFWEYCLKERQIWKPRTRTEKHQSKLQAVQHINCSLIAERNGRSERCRVWLDLGSKVTVNDAESLCYYRRRSRTSRMGELSPFNFKIAKWFLASFVVTFKSSWKRLLVTLGERYHLLTVST